MKRCLITLVFREMQTKTTTDITIPLEMRKPTASNIPNAEDMDLELSSTGRKMV